MFIPFGRLVNGLLVEWVIGLLVEWLNG